MMQTSKKYVLGLYEKSMPNGLPLRRKLEAARDSGFDFLELSIDETDEKLNRLCWSQAERRGLLADMAETGLPIRSICLSGHRKYPLGHPDPAIRARGMEIMEGAIRLACDLGVRIIQLAGYDVYYEPGTDQTRAAFRSNLRRSVELAAREGVILAFETMETDFMNTVTKAMTWVEEMESPYLQTYPDMGNITNAAVAAGKDVMEDIRQGRGHIVAAHLKETLPGIFREVPYGSGHVDFATVIRCAWQLGVRRYMAEFWYDGAENWCAMLRQNSAFLRGYLDRCVAESEASTAC